MVDLAIKRLLQAQQNGFFVDVSGGILVLGCPKPELLKVLNLHQIIICHPERAVIVKAKRLSFHTLINKKKLAKLKILRSIGASIVWVTKSRRETLFNIAMAVIATNQHGSIIINGERKQGIEYALNELKKVIDPIDILSKAHGKIGQFKRPLQIPELIKYWKNQGKFTKNTSGYITAPGIFSETIADKGSQLLTNEFVGKLYGSIVDLGAGWGFLSAEALKNNAHVDEITLIDSNSSAIKAAKINVKSSKAKFLWLDLESEIVSIKDADHVIMNPPFHKGQKVDFSVGFTFLKIAKDILKKGGTLWIVFNRESPYEKSIKSLFPNYEYLNKTKSYTIIRAKK